MKLLNFYNQKGAGPKNIALNFINEVYKSDNERSYIILVPDIQDYQQLMSEGNITIIKLPCYKNVLKKVFFRIYIEYILIPRLLRNCHSAYILAFGNFLFSPVRANKTVLLHHPYLVDDILLSKLELKAIIIERLKRVAFYLTTKMVNTIVVQSEYMKDMLLKKYPGKAFMIEVIPNPISTKLNRSSNSELVNKLIESRLVFTNKPLKILYVSRFYPHKNHTFLLKLSRQLNKLNIQHLIIVTVDPTLRGAKQFLNESEATDVSIKNIGEVSQDKLIGHYQDASFFIFTSKAETFGNPLIEAMCFALPIIVPDLPYARSVVANAGIYYQEDNVVDVVEKIIFLTEEKDVYRNKSIESYQRFSFYPDASSWIKRYHKAAFDGR